MVMRGDAVSVEYFGLKQEVVFGGGRGFALGDSIRDVAEHDAALQRRAR